MSATSAGGGAVSNTSNRDVALDFLTHLYDGTEHGWLTVFTIDRTSGNGRTLWAPVDRPEQLLDQVDTLAGPHCTWFGVATRQRRLTDGRRGGAEDCLQIPALWCDLDYAGPAHARTDLPADQAAAEAIIARFQLQPTAVVHSGNGLQPWWLLDEPVNVPTAVELLERWEVTWDRLGGGVHVDHVYDVPRIMRLPGTTNNKTENCQPLPVELIVADWTRRYGASDVLELLDEIPQPERPRITLRPDHDGGERPGDRWEAATDWAELLEPLGWHHKHTDRHGERYWVRPGNDPRGHIGATTGNTANDRLKVFTSSALPLEEGETYSKFAFRALMEHGGDHRALAQQLVAEGYGSTPSAPPPAVDPATGEITTPEPEQPAEQLVDPVGGWELVDLGEILDGDYVPPTPTIGMRSDGQALIYKGRVHSISGEPGGGKTWLALHILAEVIRDGGIGAFIDYEDTPAAAVHRMRLIGLTSDQIRHQFRYVHPDGPLVTKSGKVDLAAHDLLEALDADVVIIDSVGESLAVEGLPPNDDDAVAQWFRRLPRMLARNGAAVIGLDHVTKSKDDRGLWAIGSQRKLAAIDGAAYGVDVVVAPTKTKDGKLKITCAKDRHGTYQRGHLVANATINNARDGVEVVLVAPEEKFRPTVYMERVSRYLEEAGPTSGRQIEQNVEGKGAVIRAAMECLAAEQYVTKEQAGRGFTYASVTPFRDDIEPVDNSGQDGPRPTASHRVPADRDAVLGAPESDRVPRVPDPLRSRGPAGTRSEAQEATPDTPTDRVRVPPIDLSEF